MTVNEAAQKVRDLKRESNFYPNWRFRQAAERSEQKQFDQTSGQVFLILQAIYLDAFTGNTKGHEEKWRRLAVLIHQDLVDKNILDSQYQIEREAFLH